MVEPTVSGVRKIGQVHNARGALLLLIDDEGAFAAASWGRTAKDCAQMRLLSEQVCEGLEEGVLRIGWGEP